jgi:hypothetical protein
VNSFSSISRTSHYRCMNHMKVRCRMTPVQYLMLKWLSDNSILLEKSLEIVEMKPSVSTKSTLLFYTDLIVNNVRNLKPPLRWTPYNHYSFGN